jgi:hypothetical protein
MMILTIEQIRDVLLILKAPPHGSVPRFVERSESGRVAGAQVEGRRLRNLGSEHHPLRGQAEDHPLQDGGLAQEQLERFIRRSKEQGDSSIYRLVQGARDQHRYCCQTREVAAN